MSNGPDYSSYSNDELFEAKESINKDAYPERVMQIQQEITARSMALTTPNSEYTRCKSKQGDEYVPNEVPIWEQIKNLVLSVTVIIFGGIGVIENDLAVTVCRRCETVYHLQDGAAWVMYAALLLMAASFISEVVDHYDKRDNEHVYHKISNVTCYTGMALFALAMYLHTQ